jgi:hypothetical protein
MAKKRVYKFEDFDGTTDSYPVPQYIAKPAPGDKGFYMFKTAFDSQKTYFQPKIQSSNKDLPEE